MNILKGLLIPAAAALMLSHGGSAMAISKENQDAFFANAQKAYAYGLAGQRMAALLHCEAYLTMAVPSPNEPDLPSYRRGLRDQCTRAIVGNGGGSRGPSIGPIPIFTFRW